MHKSTSSVARGALATAWALTLSACGDSPPQGWPPPDRGLVARLLNHCPDLRGSWRLNPPAWPGNQLMIGGPAVHARTHPWETMTIEGDAAQGLQITYGRSREASELLWAELETSHRTPKQGVQRLPREHRDSGHPTAEAVRAFQRAQFGWPVHGLQLKAGRDYQCEDGWLKGRVPQTDAMLLPSLVAPWQVFGEAWFALDRQGQLVGRIDVSRKRFISLWCGDGCKGFDAGTAHGVAWGRWLRTEPAWQGEPAIPWAIPARE